MRMWRQETLLHSSVQNYWHFLKGLDTEMEYVSEVADNCLQNLKKNNEAFKKFSCRWELLVFV